MSAATDTVPMFTAPAERRQVADRLTFRLDAVPYINWNAIGERRAALGCDMVVQTDVIELTVLLYWRHEVEPRSADILVAAPGQRVRPCPLDGLMCFASDCTANDLCSDRKKAAGQ